MKTNRRPYLDVPSAMNDQPLPIEELIPYPNREVELEIGFGKGRFVLGRAEAYPNRAIVGLETRRKWVHLVTERAAKRGIENVRVWLGDARDVLPRIAPPMCVGAVFIHFPDPWWKERHQKRMVITAPLVAQVARLLRDNGTLFVQTDVDFRAAYYRETISANPELIGAGAGGTVKANPFGSRTLREVHCEEAGLPIYRMLFTRRPRQ